MDVTHAAGLQTTAPYKATLVRLSMPSGPVCLTDGGFAYFDAGEGAGVEIYMGEDLDEGVILSSVGTIKDGEGATTTRLNITVLPRSDDVAAEIGNPAAQGVRVQWWEGVIHPSTGLIVGAPELKFDGEIDKPSLSVGGSWAMVIECGTQAERQLEDNADWRLNHAFHSTVWPGELGLEYVTGVTRKLEWRERPPNPGLFKRLLNLVVPFTK